MLTIPLNTDSFITVQNLLISECQNPHSQCPVLLYSHAHSPIRKHSTRIFFAANPDQLVSLSAISELSELTENIHQPPRENQNKDDISGWIGYLAYSGEEKRLSPPDQIAEFGHYPWVFCLNAESASITLYGTTDEYALKLYEHIRSLETPSPADLASITKSKTNTFSCTEFRPIWSKDQYNNAFLKVQEYLRAGDTYQINLTHPFQAEYNGSPAATLRHIFDALEPGFGGYLKTPNKELITLSPERLVSIDTDRRITAMPIKGTIARSENPEEDLTRIKTLSASEKDNAENLMIVDLLRNDLGRTSIPGSVEASRLFEVESHPNVHHLVSTISAILKPEVTPFEAVMHAFPGGSVTGAPKKRAMEIIDELEAMPRSLYCGSLGYFANNGLTDFNIMIRTLEFKEGTVTCWGGGGITIDSDMDAEYQESLDKIERITRTLESLGKHAK